MEGDAGQMMSDLTVRTPFKQADVTRLIRGALKAGCDPNAISVAVQPDGTLRLSLRGAADADLITTSWDDA